MRLRSNRILSIIVCGVLVLFSVLGLAQYHKAKMQMGRISLVPEPAAPIRVRASSGKLIGNTAGGLAVGGVHFDKIAQPEGKMLIKAFDLGYDQKAADGNRLFININGKKLSTAIYDWQLVPIAQYADSEYLTAFTLFGHLKNKKREKEIRRQKGRILNYHPALQNTLLGLRIFQLDTLLLYPESSDLPKIDGKYLLGSGENKPDVETGYSALRRVKKIMESFPHRHQSWFVTDYVTDIEFGIENDKLLLTGSPQYYCWNFPSKISSYTYMDYEQKLKQDVSAAGVDADGQNYKKWLIEYAKTVFQNIEDQLNLEINGKRFNPLELRLPKLNTLKQYSAAEISRFIVKAQKETEKYKIVYMKEYSEAITSDLDTIRNINPAVWDAGVNLMRYSAFFRYAKQNHPAQWKKFMRSVKKVKVSPNVETPTVLMMTE
jgi:hypothetical protein